MELTSLCLNNTIVQLRKVVGQAKYRVTRKLIRRVRALKSKTNSDKAESLRKKYEKKLDRYVEDVQALKRLKPDDVSKFALLNTKTLEELKITAKTAPSDRVLYKVATTELLVSAIEEFRDKYPNWHREVPFILQRLGLQYRSRKGDRNAANIKELLKSADSTAEEDDKPVLSNDETVDTEKPESSLLDKVKSRRLEEKRARKMKMKKKGMKQKASEKGKKPRKGGTRKQEKSSESGVAQFSGPDSINGDSERRSVPLNEGRLGQMEIRRLRIDSGNDDDQLKHEDRTTPLPGNEDDQEIQQEDPFFMSGGNGKEPDGFVIDKNRWTKGFKGRDGMDRLGKERRVTSFGLPIGSTDKRKERQPVIQPRKVQRPVVGNEDLKPHPKGDDEKTLHPSWEAKRKQRLAEKGTYSAPAGKKIKFDDD